jgi:hypothetical protein
MRAIALSIAASGLLVLAALSAQAARSAPPKPPTKPPTPAQLASIALKNIHLQLLLLNGMARLDLKDLDKLHGLCVEAQQSNDPDWTTVEKKAGSVAEGASVEERVVVSTAARAIAINIEDVLRTAVGRNGSPARKALLDGAAAAFRLGAGHWDDFLDRVKASAKKFEAHDCDGGFFESGLAEGPRKLAQQEAKDGLKLIRKAGFKANLKWATATK